MSEAEIRKIVDKAIQDAIPKIVLQVIDHLPQPVVYKTLDEVPDWGKEAVTKRLNSILGNGASLDLSKDLLRAWVIQDREAERMQEMGMD